MLSSRSRRVRGFTVIELFMGMAIVAVSAALILPAMQSSRHAARTTQCKNNLKQIGIALHNYHEAFNTFPPGWVNGNQFAWSVQILPFIEQTNIYNELNFLAKYDKNNRQLHSRIETYRCSSDRGADLAAGLGRSNYAGVMVGKASNTTAESTHGGGSFGMNSRRNFRDYRDGTSNTVMVGERRSTARVRKEIPDNAKVAQPDPGVVFGTEGNWVGTNPGELSIVSSAATGKLNSNTYGVFSSPHPGGANFLVGDGSVRLISENIDVTTYLAICTTGGGETTGDF